MAINGGGESVFFYLELRRDLSYVAKANVGDIHKIAGG